MTPKVDGLPAIEGYRGKSGWIVLVFLNLASAAVNTGFAVSTGNPFNAFVAVINFGAFIWIAKWSAP